jgi:hypothetical protein
MMNATTPHQGDRTACLDLSEQFAPSGRSVYGLAGRQAAGRPLLTIAGGS